MIDQPNAIAPPQEIRISRGPIRIHDETIEPENCRAIVGAHGVDLDRNQIARTGEIREAEVHSNASDHEVAKFGVAFRRLYVRAELHEAALGDRKPERLSD